MGFMDSFKASYEKEKMISENRQKRSTYQTLEQQRNSRFKELSTYSDGQLLRKFNSSSLSFQDTDIIISILRNRGYSMDEYGNFGRR